MTFKQYLNSREVNIKVKHNSKANYIYTKQIKNTCTFYSKETKWQKNLKKNDIALTFKKFINLGEDLYKINKDKIIILKKLDDNYEVYEARLEKFLVTKHTYDSTTIEILTKWLENENYCLEEYIESDEEHMLETDCLIDLSIFSYLISSAVKNFYNDKVKNKITFQSFIHIDGKNSVSKNSYINIISNLMAHFEYSKKMYIKEESELIYDEELNQLRILRVFDNIYSLFWYTLKLYLSFISINDKDDFFTNICACGNSYIGIDKRCDNCKKDHNTDRRNKNRENKSNLDIISNLLIKNTFPIDLQTKIDNLLSNKPNRYTNNSIIKNILNEMNKYLLYK